MSNQFKEAGNLRKATDELTCLLCGSATRVSGTAPFGKVPCKCSHELLDKELYTSSHYICDFWKEKQHEMPIP